MTEAEIVPVSVASPTAWQLSRHVPNNFDFFRFVFASLVIYSHCYPLLYGENTGYATEALVLFSHGQHTFAGLAVDAFFCISGFLITHSWLRNEDFWTFFFNRCLRILPGFLVNAVLCIFVFMPLVTSAGFHSLSWTKAWADLSNVAVFDFNQNISSAYTQFDKINGSLWTIPREFRCYILIALLGVLRLLKRSGFAVFALFGLCYLSFFLKTDNSYARQFCFFLAGASFYYLRSRLVYSPIVAAACAALLIGACLLGRYLNILLPFAGTYLLLYGCFNPKLRVSGWAKYGDFSYGIYLYAFPIQQLIQVRLAHNLNPYAFFLMAFALVLPFAYLSWRFVEKPVLEMKPSPERASPKSESEGRSLSIEAGAKPARREAFHSLFSQPFALRVLAFVTAFLVMEAHMSRLLFGFIARAFAGSQQDSLLLINILSTVALAFWLIHAVRVVAARPNGRGQSATAKFALNKGVFTNAVIVAPLMIITLYHARFTAMDLVSAIILPLRVVLGK